MGWLLWRASGVFVRQRGTHKWDKWAAGWASGMQPLGASCFGRPEQLGGQIQLNGRQFGRRNLRLGLAEVSAALFGHP